MSTQPTDDEIRETLAVELGGYGWRTITDPKNSPVKWLGKSQPMPPGICLAAGTEPRGVEYLVRVPDYPNDEAAVAALAESFPCSLIVRTNTTFKNECRCNVKIELFNVGLLRICEEWADSRSRAIALALYSLAQDANAMAAIRAAKEARDNEPVS